jgi:hypothetical protein
MAGTVRHLTAIPMEVILLSSVETLYRMLALTTGEHLQRNRFRKRWVLIVPPVMILLLLVLAVVYEMMQIFG